MRQSCHTRLALGAFSGLGRKLEKHSENTLVVGRLYTGFLSLSPANLLAETIIVNSAAGKITHVPLMIIFGFVGLAYKLYLRAFLLKKKKNLFLPDPLIPG